jgi:hypothetical protein
LLVISFYSCLYSCFFKRKQTSFSCAEDPSPLLSLHLNHNGTLLVAGSAGGSVHVAGKIVRVLFYLLQQLFIFLSFLTPLEHRSLVKAFYHELEGKSGRGREHGAVQPGRDHRVQRHGWRPSNAVERPPAGSPGAPALDCAPARGHERKRRSWPHSGSFFV